MTDAPSGGGRTEMERRIVRRSLEDESFRQQLLADPKAAVERELGTPLPEGVRVVAVEETTDTVFLVLPHTSTGSRAGELSDQDLEAVAGGTGAWATCDDPTCAGNTCQGGNTCESTCSQASCPG